MNTRQIGWALCCGVILGASLVLGTRAQDKPAEPPKPDWSRLQVVTYASGLTGFFDPASGKLYLYDSNAENCFIVRQLTELGEPLKKLKN